MIRFFQSLVFLFITHSAPAQGSNTVIDTTAYFKKMIHVSDSLKNIGNYKESIYHLREWLRLYPRIEPVDPSEFDYSDTLVSYTNKLPLGKGLFYSHAQYVHGMVYLHKGGKSRVYNRDSSLFNGYILHIVQNASQYRAVLYRDGSIAKTRWFHFYSGQKPHDIQIPFKQFVPLIEKPWYWKETAQITKEGRMELNTFGDTIYISN